MRVLDSSRVREGGGLKLTNHCLRHWRIKREHDAYYPGTRFDPDRSTGLMFVGCEEFSVVSFSGDWNLSALRTSTRGTAGGALESRFMVSRNKYTDFGSPLDHTDQTSDIPARP